MDVASEYAIYLSVSKFLQLCRRSFYTLNEELQRFCTAGNRYNCHMNLRKAAQDCYSGISKRWTLIDILRTRLQRSNNFHCCRKQSTHTDQKLWNSHHFSNAGYESKRKHSAGYEPDDCGSGGGGGGGGSGPSRHIARGRATRRRRMYRNRSCRGHGNNRPLQCIVVEERHLHAACLLPHNARMCEGKASVIPKP